MMRILSLKNAIQLLYENHLPHRIHINKVIPFLLLKLLCSLLMTKSTICTYLGGVLSCIEL
jgi:hypothetical protein